MPALPDNPTLQFLILHGYWFAVPIMIIEGPIITIVMSFFASFGYFNPFAIFVLSVLSDAVSDSFFYVLGYFGGEPLISRFGKYFKLTPQVLVKVEKFFERHGGKTVFFAKVTTGLVAPVIITAGFIKMNLRKFYYFDFLGGIIWSGGLVALGYYFGRQFKGDFRNIALVFRSTGIIFFCLLLLFFIYRFYLHKIVERRFKLFGDNPEKQE